MSAVATPSDPPKARGITAPGGDRRRPYLPLLALGVSLARRGLMVTVSIAICMLTVAALSLVAVSLGSRGAKAPIHDVPILASSALAWGGGFLLAFAASAHALRKDREDGVRALVVARSRTLTGYLVARVGGLAALLALVVAGGTLVCGLVATLASTRIAAVPRTLHATGAALAFSLAFAAVIAPLAFAALGARSRVGGYLFLLAVIVLPDVVAGTMGSSLPEGVVDVLSIPSALGALRSALGPGTVEPARAVRALVALAFFVAFAVLLVRRDAVRLEREDPR